MAEKSKLKMFLFPLLIVVGAVIVAIILVVSRREPPKMQAQARAPLVETVEVTPDSHAMTVSAFGTVVPAREISIVPQVSGKVVWVNPSFVPGGILRERETMFIIDSSDYAVAVDEARSALQEAQARFQQEQGQQKVAQREWELFSDEIDSAEANRALALRRPQLQSAQAAVSAARARLQRARLNVERTRVRAPFNSFVRNETVEIGQLVGAQRQVGMLVGTDQYWVRVALPEEKIPYMDIPGVNAKTGSRVRIRHTVGAKLIERHGQIEKLLGDLDPVGLMARLLVSVNDPLALRDVADSVQQFLPLLVDAYVEVFIHGPVRKGIYALPQAALRNGQQIYLFSPDSTLRIVEPRIAWSTEDSVFVDEGLKRGDRVVISALTSSLEGMRLRQRQPEDAPGGRGKNDRPENSPPAKGRKQ